MESLQGGFASGNIVESLDLLLSEAIVQGVSDIHFRTEARGVRIMLRKDGLLHNLLTLPPQQAEVLSTRLKVLGRLVTYQKRVPQDGHIDPKPYTRDEGIDIRIAIAPVVGGEQAVVRFLYGAQGLLPLESLGWEAKARQRYVQAIERGRGVVLLTGPCGSGKTTTIAASLQTLLQKGGISIGTVEDPVEYRLDGISQMNVDRVAGLGFAQGVSTAAAGQP